MITNVNQIKMKRQIDNLSIYVGVSFLICFLIFFCFSFSIRYVISTKVTIDDDCIVAYSKRDDVFVISSLEQKSTYIDLIYTDIEKLPKGVCRIIKKGHPDYFYALQKYILCKNFFVDKETWNSFKDWLDKNKSKNFYKTYYIYEFIEIPLDYSMGSNKKIGNAILIKRNYSIENIKYHPNNHLEYDQYISEDEFKTGNYKNIVKSEPAEFWINRVKK